jgi:phosphoribosylaminoimidazolecarboxamide formyltransferase / IMP cyclohydrolase
VVPRRALLSVSDKTGLPALGAGLSAQGFELVSTGGTATALRQAGLTVTDVSALTGFPEILDGRVKTLHPAIFGGILARRDLPSHVAETSAHGIRPYDLVAVNLYPFEEKALHPKVALPDALELIDIGGPSLVRAAAKNHPHVLVLTDPADYDAALRELRAGGPSAATRLRMAAKAFAHTARYDALIAHYLNQHADGERFPPTLVLPLTRRELLRYGENHHQTAAFYGDDLGLTGSDPGAAHCRQLHGKPLSYNNLLDADAVVEALKEFAEPTVVIVKHVTPSGIASADSLEEAWRHAYATDTYSPFGGVVGCNRTVDASLARQLTQVFLELIVAPSFAPDALAVLSTKKNLRLLEVPRLGQQVPADGATLTSITGGFLLQERDLKPFDPASWRTVSKRRPTADELRTMLFAARCVKHVKSNAVVFAKDTRTVGIGGGQTARVDASYIAVFKGKQNIRGSVMASEAFFPFRDAVDVAAENGVVAIVQPGGSIRDDEVIRAADEHGIAMMFSGHRSFRH